MRILSAELFGSGCPLIAMMANRAKGKNMFRIVDKDFFKDYQLAVFNDVTHEQVRRPRFLRFFITKAPTGDGIVTFAIEHNGKKGFEPQVYESFSASDLTAGKFVDLMVPEGSNETFRDRVVFSGVVTGLEYSTAIVQEL